MDQMFSIEMPYWLMAVIGVALIFCCFFLLCMAVKFLWWLFKVGAQYANKERIDLLRDKIYDISHRSSSEMYSMRDECKKFTKEKDELTWQKIREVDKALAEHQTRLDAVAKLLVPLKE